MKKNCVQYYFEPDRLWIRFFKIKIDFFLETNQ